MPRWEILVIALLVFAAQFNVATVQYVSPEKTRESNGISFTTIAECVSKLSGPGDECRLQTGIYHESTVVVPPVHGTAAAPVVIGAMPGARVVIDGTTPVGPTSWKNVGGGRWRGRLPPGAPEPTQLFVDDEMMTPARWPNARWDDRSVFDWTMWAQFNTSAPWTPAHFTPGKALTFYDKGQLKKLSTSIAGAIFIGNIGHMDTFAGKVLEHVVGSNTFTVMMDDRLSKVGNSKVGNSIYFVEGLPSLVDGPSEWAYDRVSRDIIVATVDGQSPSGRDVRVKSQDYAFNITNASHLVLANLSFFGTTIHANGHIPFMSLESLVFRYPSFSRRMVGDTSTAASTVLAASSTSFDGGVPDPADSSFSVFNCTWFGADGATVQYYGTAGRWINNEFAFNDWTGHDTNDMRGMGSVVVLATMGQDDVFVRNTLWGNGPSVGYGAGARAIVRENRCFGQADIANDGACIQIRSTSATGALVSHNWATNSAKGLRLDSGSNTKWVPEERNNTFLGNVAFLCNGIELKNDYNFYKNNLALLPPDIPVHGSTATEVFRVDNTRFKGENAHSVVTGNVASSWISPLAGITNASAPNVLSVHVLAQFRDPWNFDFRPVRGSAVDLASAGPYDYMGTAAGKCSTGGARYVIPGRQHWRVSTPLPPNGTRTASPTLDLMFQPAYASSRAHTVYLARSRAALRAAVPLGTLPAGCNVQNVTVAGGPPLPPGSTWWWRVDEVGGLPGPPWTFLVGGGRAPPPPPPGSNCTAAEVRLCPGLARKGGVCEQCVVDHNGAFRDAGCFHKGDRHAFIEAYCY